MDDKVLISRRVSVSQLALALYAPVVVTMANLPSSEMSRSRMYESKEFEHVAWYHVVYHEVTVT